MFNHDETFFFFVTHFQIKGYKNVKNRLNAWHNVNLNLVQVKTDPWCSCGGLTPDGTLVVAGGFADGGKTSRYYGGQPDCQDCDWREYPNKLQEPRWYVDTVFITIMFI